MRDDKFLLRKSPALSSDIFLALRKDITRSSAARRATAQLKFLANDAQDVVLSIANGCKGRPAQ